MHLLISPLTFHLKLAFYLMRKDPGTRQSLDTNHVEILAIELALDWTASMDSICFHILTDSVTALDNLIGRAQVPDKYYNASCHCFNRRHWRHLASLRKVSRKTVGAAYDLGATCRAKQMPIIDYWSIFKPPPTSSDMYLFDFDNDVIETASNIEGLLCPLVVT